jgi:hypothetical protein
MIGFVPAAMRIAITLLWIGLLPRPVWSACAPTKVFLLAGQSNMVGESSVLLFVEERCCVLMGWSHGTGHIGIPVHDFRVILGQFGLFSIECG